MATSKSKKGAAKETAATEALADGPSGEIQERTVVPTDEAGNEVTGTETVAVAGATEGSEKPKRSRKVKEPVVKADSETKGKRNCASCGTPEAEYLLKNDRYSLCQGVDVNCYRKGDRVLYGTTMEQARAAFPNIPAENFVQVPTADQQASGQANGIKPGILVKGAMKPAPKPKKEKAKKTETAATSAPVAATATEASSPTSA